MCILALQVLAAQPAHPSISRPQGLQSKTIFTRLNSADNMLIFHPVCHPNWKWLNLFVYLFLKDVLKWSFTHILRSKTCLNVSVYGWCHWMSLTCLSFQHQCYKIETPFLCVHNITAPSLDKAKNNVKNIIGSVYTNSPTLSAPNCVLTLLIPPESN